MKIGNKFNYLAWSALHRVAFLYMFEELFFDSYKDVVSKIIHTSHI